MSSIQIDEVIRAVSELPDRNSPEDQPEMMLVSADELREILVEQIAAPLQRRVQPWMIECFGPIISADKQERNHRFLEEALELVQACGATQGEAHQLVDYVYGPQIGDPFEEVGGVMITLAALCLANDLDMHQAGEVELAHLNEGRADPGEAGCEAEAFAAAGCAIPRLPSLPGVPSKPVVGFMNTGEDWTQHYEQELVLPCKECSATGNVNDMINTRYFVRRMQVMCALSAPN